MIPFFQDHDFIDVQNVDQVCGRPRSKHIVDLRCSALLPVAFVVQLPILRCSQELIDAGTTDVGT